MELLTFASSRLGEKTAKPLMQSVRSYKLFVEYIKVTKSRKWLYLMFFLIDQLGGDMQGSNHINKIVSRLGKYIQESDGSTYNYERFLLKNKLKYLEAFIDEKPFPPFEVEIQMSSRCNLSCRWCIGAAVQAQ